MSDAAPLRVGPVLGGVVVCPDLGEAVAAYTEFLAQRVLEKSPLEPQTAQMWQAPLLAGAPTALLASESGVPWLRLVEDPDAGVAEPFRTLGWMALEVLVEDPDALALTLADSPFRILGEPAGLELNPEIRAMQVQGPAGEVLYLTRTGEAETIFQLPRARCAVDRLFIGVLSAVQREQSLSRWEQLAGGSGHRFETLLGAVNRAWGYPPARQHPVAALQLAGQSLVEIDQLPAAEPPSVPAGRLAAGIALLSFAVDDLEAEAFAACSPPCTPPGAFYRGRRATLARGADQERIELVEHGTEIPPIAAEPPAA